LAQIDQERAKFRVQCGPNAEFGSFVVNFYQILIVFFRLKTGKGRFRCCSSMHICYFWAILRLLGLHWSLNLTRSGSICAKLYSFVSNRQRSIPLLF